MSENYKKNINKPSGTVLEQWRRVVPLAAADEGNETGGSGTSSSSLSPYASGDLQNTQKRNKQLILVFFFLVHGSVCFHFRSAFLLVSPSSLFRRPTGEWVSVDGCAAAGGRSMQRRACGWGRGRRLWALSCAGSWGRLSWWSFLVKDCNK